MTTENPWELYSSMDGWEAVSQRLDEALARTLARLDTDIAGGSTIPTAARNAWAAMETVLEQDKDYGAQDTEPRSTLADRLERHLRKRYGAEVTVTRFGDIDIDID